MGLICGLALIAMPVSRVSADSLQLIGAAPAGTVYLYGSALPAPYTDAAHAVDAYAGVLDWKDTNTNLPVYTYCVDVAAIIYTGHTYQFETLQPLTASSLPSFTSQEINGIYNLWTDSNFATATGVNGPVTTATPQDAAMFQVAIWDILYNNGSTSLTNSALSFAGPSNGLDLTSLQNALNYAHADYNAGPASNPGVMALIATDGSQNQALYIGSTGHQSAVPLPASFTAGIALLGLLGAAGAWRIAANRKQNQSPLAG
jgi:hypothetical protein